MTMAQTVATLNSRRQLLFIGVLWILFWIIPWGRFLSFEENLYLVFLSDMAKLGLALGVFILPGALLYILLQEKMGLLFEFWGIVPIGFTFSVALIGAIGILGRLLGFSFGLVKCLFALVGLGEIMLLSYLKPALTIRKEHVLRLFRSIVENIPLALALVLAVSVAFNEYLFFIDDTIYQAYLTNWQYSTRLGFHNIVHQANIVESVRFWLALYPMGQALFSSLSGIPGILLFSNYLELSLVPLAVITAYWFARVLGLSRTMAGFSVLMQVLIYTLMIYDYWPVGFWFFINMAEDKVSAVFLLAPVFFIFVIKYLEASTRTHLTMVLIASVALMFTHPVILFYCCLIGSGIGCCAWYAKKTGWRSLLGLSVVIITVMVPYLSIRLYEPYQREISFDAQSAITTFHADRFINVVGDFFYGINPNVLMFLDISPENNLYSAFQIIRLLPILLALVAGVLAFMKVKAGALYWYVLSCVILIMFAIVPYTGWILGYFVSARLISRASWFSPLGLASVMTFKLISDCLKSNMTINKFVEAYSEKVKKESAAYARIFKLSAVVIALAVVASLPRVPSYFMVLDHNNQLARVGEYVDQHTSGPTTVTALNYRDMLMLPGVAANASLISFREETDRNGHNFFLSLEEIHERIHASNTIRSLDPSTSTEERCRLLEKYTVRFVLAPSDTAGDYASEVNKCGMTAKDVFSTNDMVLLELK